MYVNLSVYLSNDYIMNRRIAIYLDKRTQFAQIQFNHSVTKKISNLIARQGVSKNEFAVNTLKEAFNTDNVTELKERIIYASNTMDIGGQENQKIANTCKVVMKRVIDSY